MEAKDTVYAATEIKKCITQRGANVHFGDLASRALARDAVELTIVTVREVPRHVPRGGGAESQSDLPQHG